MPENLKNRQLNLSFYIIKVAFYPKNVAQAKFFSKSYTLQALWHSKTPYFQDSLEIKQKFEKLKLNCEKNSS